MKKINKKKGFTIVELVIVIAVIAILAAVMIPTFSGVIGKANESAAMQKLTAAYKDAYAVALSDGSIAADEEATSGQFKFKFGADGTSCTVSQYPENFGYTATFSNGAWTMTKTGG